MGKRITGILHRQSIANLRQLKLWAADDIMIADSYTTAARLVFNPATGKWEKVGQFSLIQVYQTDSAGNQIGDMSANQNARNISHDEMQFIASIQRPSDGFTLDQVMGWLTNGGDGQWGSPIRCTGDWRTATDGKLIAAFYAGQVVEVLEYRTFARVAWQGQIEAFVNMARIKTGGVQEVTAVDKDDHPILPHGHVYVPAWFKAPQAWVFERWLMGL